MRQFNEFFSDSHEANNQKMIKNMQNETLMLSANIIHHHLAAMKTAQATQKATQAIVESLQNALNKMKIMYETNAFVKNNN